MRRRELLLSREPRPKNAQQPATVIPVEYVEKSRPSACIPAIPFAGIAGTISGDGRNTYEEDSCRKRHYPS